MFAQVEGTIVATSPIFKYKGKEYVKVLINYVCNSDNLLKPLFVIMSLILQNVKGFMIDVLLVQ